MNKSACLRCVIYLFGNLQTESEKKILQDYKKGITIMLTMSVLCCLLHLPLILYNYNVLPGISCLLDVMSVIVLSTFLPLLNLNQCM